MQVTAQLNNLRIAPRKVRLVAQVLRGMPVEKAESQLDFTVKRSAGHLKKLLKSAVSNAENNFGLVKENLFIKELIVNEGRKLKRNMPRAMGQSNLIEKKSSHLRIVLEEKVSGLKRPRAERPAADIDLPSGSKSQKSDETRPQRKATSAPGRPTSAPGRSVMGGVRKFFRRKSI